MKISLSVCILMLCAIAAQGQTKATTEDGRKVILNTDGTWKYAEVSPSIALKIEAGLVYNDGGSKPVARTNFALLDADPMPEITKLPPSEIARRYSMDVNNAKEEFLIQCGFGMPEAMAVIGRHTRYTMTTGFDGKGEFTDVKPDKYWLFGAIKIGEQRAFWLVAVDLNKDQNMILDNSNIAIGKPMTFRR